MLDRFEIAGEYQIVYFTRNRHNIAGEPMFLKKEKFISKPPTISIFNTMNFDR
jgi:hypothetical protein